MKTSLAALLVAALTLSVSAQAEIAVVVHPDSPAATLTSEQIAAIYLGRDTRFAAIDLPERVGFRHWFYYKITGRDATQINILRAKQIARMPPTVAANSVDAMRRVAANKYAVAYVDKRAVDASVKVIMTIQNPAPLDLRAQD